MNVLKKAYRRFCEHRKKETKEIIRSQIILENLKDKNLFSQECLTNDEPRDEQVIVSLTSFGIRLNWVFYAIESIAHQTMKPNKIVLWLSENEFNNENLPLSIKRLIDRGLTVQFRKDLRSYTKLIYALKEYKNDVIITIDDDIVYPFDLIENLYQVHLKYPGLVCCNVAKPISKELGTGMKYNNLKNKSSHEEVSKTLMPLGVNGVLYCPNCLDREVFNVNKIFDLCPSADDIWFKAMALKNETNTVISGCYPELLKSFIPLESSSIDALTFENITKSKNDNQFRDVWKHYSLFNISLE